MKYVRSAQQAATRREFCLLQTVAVAADTAVDGRTGKRIGNNEQKLGTSYVSQKTLCDHTCVLLNEYDFGQRDRNSDCQSGVKDISGIFRPAHRYFSGYSPGERCLYSGSSERKTQGIDGEDKLIETDAFFSEGMAEKNAEKESHETAEQSGGCQDQCAADHFMFY